jgi:hypothetical protein
MARKHDPVFVRDVLKTEYSAEEARLLWDLILRAKEAEQFVLDGWDKWGADWPDHIPINERGMPIINELAWVLFRYRFQMYQAKLHHCPIHDRCIMGGRRG